MNIRRIFVEKKEEFNIEAESLTKEFKEHLLISEIEKIRILHRYDVENISEETYNKARKTIFAEPPVDLVYDENIEIEEKARIFAIEYLPGQYDQRADSASQAIQIITQGERPNVKYAKVIIIKGEVSDSDFDKIKTYMINPVDSREALTSKPSTLEDETLIPDDIPDIENFISMTELQLSDLIRQLGLAMDLDDVIFCQEYFKNKENRNPTMTEMRILDTYWSDHCRHTTFLTKINKIEFEEGQISNKIKQTYEQYLIDRKDVYGERESKIDICLMDIATLAMKKLRNSGKLVGLDESEEINACSIEIEVDIDGQKEGWLVMFKNETHNHPTEIEPFGGAATCLGGAIRDPLSGRAFVYQAMRVTGSGDPRSAISETIKGKLPQRKITTEAAHGYSSYGNQIGLSTGLVDEIYHPGYIAKRMEIGAVIGAAPKYNVVREKPVPGDIVVLIGGKTGRDGCGGATGSSKAHTEESIISCGAEVQKGNAPEERKIQRLFRDPEVTRMIKRCNDFGAGGVSVAVGELAEGLEINLDAVPKKYDGLDGTELAISESQERMACVIKKNNEKIFKEAVEKENMQATTIAEVKKEKRVKMYWRGKTIVDISREFLDSNGATKNSKIKIVEPKDENYFNKSEYHDVKDRWYKMLADLNVASKKGLVERFDNCVGAATVNYPFGGKYQLTPTESMTAKIPVLKGETTTGTIMSYGYDPYLSNWSPFHGAVYAVVESVAKIIAAGGNYNSIWFSFQEYFERLGDDPERWGKPASALLGAYYAQTQFERAAIGGKDSMSGSFKDLDVPPALVSFAVEKADLEHIISPEFKTDNSVVIYIPVQKDENFLPDFDILKSNYGKVTELVKNYKINAIHTVKANGIAEAVSKMTFGNKIGFEFHSEFNISDLFTPDNGGLVIELKQDISLDILDELDFILLGKTIKEEKILINEIKLDLNEAINIWSEPLEDIFPTKIDVDNQEIIEYTFERRNIIVAKSKIAEPRVLIPVFPGTNSEYDSVKAFEQAGAKTKNLPVRNLTPKMIEETIDELSAEINNSQIVFIPGGFSAGDEPEGSGKFIAAIFRNPRIKDSIHDLLQNRDGLILGVCNGFQALIKLGLLPYGQIRDITEDTPTLTFNKIGRHVSKIIYTKVVSNISPWLSNVDLGTVQAVPISHGEGRFVANLNWINKLKTAGQIATQYVDFNGKPSMDVFFNPNSSYFGIEGITSPDGKVFGKMGHNERLGRFVGKNIPGNKEIRLFKAGVDYFK